MEFKKAKSASKVVVPRGQALDDAIDGTLRTIADVVGSTLGPGGHPVLLERGEWGLPPSITKDGVTVFKALGFRDPVAQCILESARDVAVRTAEEAGDGTTTATILAAAIHGATRNNSVAKTTPQLVRQQIQRLFADVLQPAIRAVAIHPTLADPEGRRQLRAVARLSANGDDGLADAVMQCFDVCGDDGNVTIEEASGLARYEVEQVRGYPVAMGFEESMGVVHPAFVNDEAANLVRSEKPIFLLYFGKLFTLQPAIHVLARLDEAWRGGYLKTPNVVLVATHFGPQTLEVLARNFRTPDSLNVLPLLVPHDSPVHNAQRHFLDDLAALTGGTVFDPVTRPLDDAQFEDLGNLLQEADPHTGNPVYVPAGITDLEMGRYRTTVLGLADPEAVMARADTIRKALESPASALDADHLRVRLAKLTHGIARLRVFGSSTGDLRERRDRAEDAICAVRGALRAGAVPGGCWVWIYLTGKLLSAERNAGVEILLEAFRRPFEVLCGNVGLDGPDIDQLWDGIEFDSRWNATGAVIWNAETRQVVNAVEAGILDSLPAVEEALKNAVSIASQLGTLGGVVVFPRDDEFDRREGGAHAEFGRMADHNPADERP